MAAQAPALDAAFSDLIGRPVKVMRPDSDMLDAFALVTLEILDNLPGLAPVFVDRDADAPAG